MRTKNLCVAMLGLLPLAGLKVAADAPPTAAPKVKYVRIEKKSPIISIAELQVYVGCQNVAESGNATQSSTAYDGQASRAIDGKTDGDYNNGSITHTDENEENPWFQLELKECAVVDAVTLWNRTDCCFERMDDAKLILLDADKKPIAEVELRDVAPSVKYKLSEGKLHKVE